MKKILPTARSGECFHILLFKARMSVLARQSIRHSRWLGLHLLREPTAAPKKQVSTSALLGNWAR